jgi:hypothetical protein
LADALRNQFYGRRAEVPEWQIVCFPCILCVCHQRNQAVTLFIVKTNVQQTNEEQWENSGDNDIMRNINHDLIKQSLAMKWVNDRDSYPSSIATLPTNIKVCCSLNGMRIRSTNVYNNLNWMNME